MRYLIVAVGSHGDVHPLLGLAMRLRDRGQEVTFVVNEYFGPLVRSAGVEHVTLGEAELFIEGLKNPDLWHRARGGKAVFQFGVLPLIRPTFDIITEQIKRGPTCVIAHAIALGARMAKDKYNVPLITTQLQPAAFRTVYEVPRLHGFPVGPNGPRWVKRMAWGFADFVIDAILRKPINAIRSEVGLPSIKWILKDWWMSPDMVLAMFPDWFGPRQPDWPEQTVLTGFPLYDERGLHPLSPERGEGGGEGFLRGGGGSEIDRGFPETPLPASPLSGERGRSDDRPIAFTPGSAMTHGADFFRESAEACRLLKRRGILLTRHAEQIPANLPSGVAHVPYAPFSELLPRVAALVHHGGIGTTAQAMAAGCPQLIMPLAHDQFDNADRVERLGVGMSIERKRYHAPRVAEKLAALLGNGQVSASCRAITARFSGVDAIADACDLIETFASKHSPR